MLQGQLNEDRAMPAVRRHVKGFSVEGSVEVMGVS